MKAYHIKDWDVDRENSETRRYVDLLWFRTKVKLVGEGLGHTLNAAGGRGPHLYGMFKLIEQIASGGRLSMRGWLVRNGSPMDAERMGNLLRLPAQYFEEALKFFSTPPMDWLEYIELPDPSSNDQQNGGRSPDKSTSEKPTTSNLQQNGGRSPDKSTSEKPTTSNLQQNARQNAISEEHTNVVQHTNRERERIGSFSNFEDSASAQRLQFVATKRRIGSLEEVAEDDRTREQEEELKKMRMRLKKLEKKQSAGDFTPLTD